MARKVSGLSRNRPLQLENYALTLRYGFNSYHHDIEDAKKHRMVTLVPGLSFAGFSHVAVVKKCHVPLCARVRHKFLGKEGRKEKTIFIFSKER